MEPERQVYLTFEVGGEHYALPGDTVREITRWRAVTPVPGAPPVLPGIINQRGTILPVVVLHALLGLPIPDGPARSTRYIVAGYGEAEMALLADAVLDLVAFAPAQIEPLPEALDAQRARLLSALAHHEERPIAMIDVSALVHALRPGA